MKYDDALTQCRTQKADLFYVRADHDLDQLMEFFNVTKIWTNVSKSRQGSLQDRQGFYPELMGKFGAISLENFNLAGFTNKARIVLTCELGLYEMKIVPDSEPQDALCFQPLKFPYRESDQANLLFLKKTYTEAIQAHLQSFKPVVRKAKSVFNSLPKLQYNDTGELTFDDIVHRGAELEKNIAKEKTIGKIRANLFANLNETIQLPRIGVRLPTQLFRITNMIQFVTDTIENSLVAVEQIFNSAYFWSEDKNYPMSCFELRTT